MAGARSAHTTDDDAAITSASVATTCVPPWSHGATTAHDRASTTKSTTTPTQESDVLPQGEQRQRVEHVRDGRDRDVAHRPDEIGLRDIDERRGVADGLDREAAGEQDGERDRDGRPRHAAIPGQRARRVEPAVVVMSRDSFRHGIGSLRGDRCRIVSRTKPVRICCSTRTTPWTGIRGAPEAFERARREDKPILLSIGYAACHWCHVMERESFEDEATARVMNERFVNIKVDREERPDVDRIYMQAVQAMTGHGGWPMTVFLTPDGRAVLRRHVLPAGRPSGHAVLPARAAARCRTRTRNRRTT